MNITTPLTAEKIKNLKIGDKVTITGTIYTGRDAAHKRLCEAIDRGEELPFDVKDAIIYYVGPCPHREGQVIGSCGPTTSYRMDAYAPKLIELGLRGMIGKGERNDNVKNAIVEHGAVYFGAIGGAGALLAKHVTASEVIAYDDLGTEAIRRLTVKDFPVTVVIDSAGADLYIQGKAAFAKK
ncbi:MAG: Fe-S-containing hydro-lyase [Clostridia bacterium]|nr:Fe-S-containing hydro-lyase [Clostridia bacterium]